MTQPKLTATVIFERAEMAAIEATNEYLRCHGEHPMNCGFAWVTIKPARGFFVNHLKKVGVGQNGYHGGWQVWNPGKNLTQDMSAKMAGATAFAKVLKANGVKCAADCRLD